MADLNKNDLRTDYLHMFKLEFRHLLRHIGESENSASLALDRNRHYLAQQTRVSPMLIEQYKNIIGDTVFFDGYAAVLDRREKFEQLRQARLKEEADELRMKEEKSALRRAKRQARLNRPAL
ncbi:MAG: hypothetical protein KAH48_02255 [Chlorobi bacterium]|nr:hypothetical protein [Chlorobiota bacterium]